MTEQDDHAVTSGEPGGDEEHGVSGGEADEERPVERGENATQRRMDAEGIEDAPVDVSWEETEASPHEGDAGRATDI
jgi:hypothetical protein